MQLGLRCVLTKYDKRWSRNLYSSSGRCPLSPSSNDLIVSARPNRRRRSSGTTQPLPDLLTVPGIGPRSKEKLVAKGIARIDELKQLYREKFGIEGCDRMTEYLVSSVGIYHRNHALSIASFIKSVVEEEPKQRERESKEDKRTKTLTFCGQGNISVGKTTFFQRIANATIELRELVEAVPEPMSKWQDVSSHNSASLRREWSLTLVLEHPQ